MRFCTLLILLLGWASQAAAQDLILTIQGDSIICKIDRTDDRFVYYRTIDTRRTKYELISKREVKNMIYDAFVGDIPEIAGIREDLGYDRFQIWGFGGFSRLLNAPGDLPEDFDEYSNDLRSSFFFSGGFNVYLNEQIGLGGFFSTSSYSNSVDVITTTTPPVTGVLADDISLRYIGANMALRLQTEVPALVVQLDLGLGLSQFINEGSILYAYRVDGNGVGGHISTSLQLMLGNGVYIPVFVRLLGFNINRVNYVPGEDVPSADLEALELTVLSNFPLNTSRIQLGTGLVISF